MFTLTTPVTGALQTGFTAPTYTIVADTPPPNVAGKQYAVTALGGTQAGVDVSSASRPFTILLNRPAQVFLPPSVSNGVASGPVKRNNYDITVRKGVTAVVGLPSNVAIGRIRLEVPAGSDVNDPANLRALCSLMQGALTQLAAELANTLVTGVP